MRIWLLLLLPSAIMGLFFARFLKNRAGIIFSVAIPWFGFLTVLVYDVYLTPYDETDTSMWFIAQLIGGSVQAFVGYAFYSFGRKLFG